MAIHPLSGDYDGSSLMQWLQNFTAEVILDRNFNKTAAKRQSLSKPDDDDINEYCRPGDGSITSV
ncbi:hypothetical protein [Tistrella mobilis]|nr:hypothetical protein [Tistrella mobilis]